MLTKVLHHMGEAVSDRQVQRRPPLTRGAGKGRRGVEAAQQL